MRCLWRAAAAAGALATGAVPAAEGVRVGKTRRTIRTEARARRRWRRVEADRRAGAVLLAQTLAEARATPAMLVVRSRVVAAPARRRRTALRVQALLVGAGAHTTAPVGATTAVAAAAGTGVAVVARATGQARVAVAQATSKTACAHRMQACQHFMSCQLPR